MIHFWVFVIVVLAVACIMFGVGFLWGSMWMEAKFNAGIRVSKAFVHRHVGSKAFVHRHVGSKWDGYYEQCRCGAVAGDRRDKNGNRYVSFEDWPK